MKGTVVFGCRPEQDKPDDWTKYTLQDQLGQTGGSASVFDVAPLFDPPLVAKIFNDRYRSIVSKEQPYAHRLVLLALHRGFLENHDQHPLTFALWPRRILFDTETPPPDTIEKHVLGFTMKKLKGTTSLQHILNNEQSRARLTPDLTLDIAITIANQLKKMHTHPWNFVFADMSPNNIHLSFDFRHVYFIDTDSFQFDAGAAFLPGGLTPGFSSPGATAAFNARQNFTADHDNFVFATLVFMLLMADKGFTGAHPFQCGSHSEDDLIDRRIFPFDNPTAYPVSPHVLKAYETLPDDIRQAFTTSFTKAPLRAEQWAVLLNANRRLLCPR